jgi:hypothetical protein
LRCAIEHAPPACLTGARCHARCAGEMAQRRFCPSPWKRCGSTAGWRNHGCAPRCILQQFPTFRPTGAMKKIRLARPSWKTHPAGAPRRDRRAWKSSGAKSASAPRLRPRRYVSAVSVVPDLADGRKCARSWRITDDVGSDPAFPDVSARDAAALHELKALGRL